MATYLLERIAEDEQIARAACARDDVAEHWQWVVSTAIDQVVHDVGREDADQAECLSLCSVETHPTEFDGPLPTFALRHVNDHTVALPHIARHDPARVIAECETKRRVVQLCRDASELDDWVTTALAEEMLLHLVQVYTDRPDFPPEWLPEVAW